MTYEEKMRLARTGDYSDEAASMRLRAARMMSGLSQLALGKEIGVGKAAVNNMENGRSYPNKKAFIFFHQSQRLDANYFVLGEFRQLPSDVQEGIFPLLAELSNDADPQSN